MPSFYIIPRENGDGIHKNGSLPSTDRAKEHLKRSHQILFSIWTTEFVKEISTSKKFFKGSCSAFYFQICTAA